MKRYFKITGTLMCVVTCAVFFAHGAGAEPVAPLKSVDGTVTAQQVQAKLQADGFSPLTKITVDARDDGSVNLKGIAVSDAEAARAVALAKEVRGVTAVESEILVKRIPVEDSATNPAINSVGQ